MTVVHALILGCVVIASAAPQAGSAAQPAAGTASVDDQLAVQTGFERDIIAIIRDESKSPLHRLSGYDEEGYQILANGVVVSVPHGRAGQVLLSLKNRIAPRRYLAFIVEENPTTRTDRIAVLHGSDQYEILRIMHTHGEDADVDLEDVIETLKAWERRYPFEIIGAENEWLELEFKTLPADLKGFVNEVAEFCPDMVDGSAAQVMEMIRELTTTKRLMLWWD